MNESITTDQVAKLPKWAQQRIKDADRRCGEAESALKDYLDNQSPSLLYTRNGLTEKSYIQDDRVSFQLKNGEITVALRRDVLECHASYRGSGRLLVIPHVTNVIHLEIEDVR